MKLPSDKYFISVQTKEDYYYFLSTGLLWELEPLAPSSWQEHMEMVEYRIQEEFGSKGEEE